MKDSALLLKSSMNSFKAKSQLLNGIPGNF